jgi:hypothetical protein
MTSKCLFCEEENDVIDAKLAQGLISNAKKGPGIS